MYDEYDALKFYNETYKPLSKHIERPKHRMRPKLKKHTPKNNYAPLIRRQNKASYQMKQGCIRKIKYDTEEQAIAVIERRKPKALTFYNCRFCEGFHLTSVRNEKV